MKNTFETVMFILKEDDFSPEELYVLENDFREIPQELMQVVNRLNDFYFRRGFAKGLEFKENLKRI